MEENWMELYDFLEKTGFSYHISFKKIMARMGMEDVSRKSELSIGAFYNLSRIPGMLSAYKKMQVNELIELYDDQFILNAATYDFGWHYKWDGNNYDVYRRIPLVIKKPFLSEKDLREKKKVRDILMALALANRTVYDKVQKGVIGIIFLSETENPENAFSKKLGSKRFQELVEYCQLKRQLPPRYYFEAVVRMGLSVYEEKFTPIGERYWSWI